METLKLTSPAFADGGSIPKRHTGFGENLSPALCLSGLCDAAVSVTLVLDDLDVPFCKTYCHWLVWNLPPVAELPEGIPHGSSLPALGNAAQALDTASTATAAPIRRRFFALSTGMSSVPTHWTAG